jgi:hypothetical protein
VGDKINSSLGLSNHGPRQNDNPICRSWLHTPSQGSMNLATTLSISVSCTVNIYWKCSLQRRVREETGIYCTVLSVSLALLISHLNCSASFEYKNSQLFQMVIRTHFTRNTEIREEPSIFLSVLSVRSPFIWELYTLIE